MKSCFIFLFLFFTILASGQTVVRADSFGAIPNDGIDDQPAILAALNSVSATTPIIVELTSGGTYHLSSRLELRTKKKLRTHPDSLPAIIKPTGDISGMSGLVYTVSGQSQIKYSLGSISIALTSGSNQFTVPRLSMADSLLVGHIIWLQSAQLVSEYTGYPDPDPYFAGIVGTIEAVSGSTVTISATVPRTFTATGLVVFCSGGSTLSSWYSVEDVELSNVLFDFRGTTQTGGKAVEFSGTKNSTIKKVYVYGDPHLTNAINQGINTEYCVNVLIDSCRVDGGKLDGGTGQYAISPNGWNITVKNSYASNWASGIVAGSRDHFTYTKLIRDTVIKTNGSGTFANFHGLGQGLMDSCFFYGETAGSGVTARFDNFTIRNSKIVIDNTVARSAYVSCVSVSENANKNILFENNYMRMINPSDLSAYAIALWNRPINYKQPLSNVRIIGNRIDGTIIFPRGPYNSNNSSSDTFADSIIVAGNYFENTSPSKFPYVHINSSTAGWNYRFSDNTFKSEVGNISNFCIKIEGSNPSGAIVSNNSFYLTNPANTYTSSTQQILTTGTITQASNSVYDYLTPPPVFPVIPRALRRLARGSGKLLKLNGKLVAF